MLVFRLGQTEEEQAADSQGGGVLSFFHGFVHRQVEHAGHGADGLADGFAGADEEGVDQVAGIEGRFADQRAERFRAAEPPHAGFGERHG